MQITELLGLYEEGNGTLFFLLARHFKAIPNPMRTSCLVNIISPSVHYERAVGLITFRDQMQFGTAVVRPEHLGIVRAGGMP